MSELLFRKEAEHDLSDIKDYYDKISTGLTDGFFKELWETTDLLEQAPQIFQIRYREVRIAPLYRFPYGIHYRELGDKIIIYRILHTKRYFKQN